MVMSFNDWLDERLINERRKIAKFAQRCHNVIKVLLIFGEADDFLRVSASVDVNKFFDDICKQKLKDIYKNLGGFPRRLRVNRD